MIALRRALGGAALGGLLAFAGPACALPLYTTGVDLSGDVDGYVADVDWGGSGAETAAHVLLTAEARVDQLSWSGSYYDADTPQDEDVFRLRILADDGGRPGAEIVSMALDPTRWLTTHALRSGLRRYHIHGYRADLPTPTVLGPGLYWFSIYDDTTVDTDDTWYWTGSLSGESYGNLAVGSSDWFHHDHHYTPDLTVSGDWVGVPGPIVATPAPPAMALLAGGLAALGLARRRRRAG